MTLVRPTRYSMDEDPDKALAAIQNKPSNPLPKGLRNALGQSLIERPYRELDSYDPRLTAFDEPPVIPGVRIGTPSPAQPREELQAPWQINVGLRERLAHAIILVQLGPVEIWDVLVQVLDIPASIETLSYHIVVGVENQGLLAGYSALAIAGGCLYFAAYALQTPLGRTSSDLEHAGMNFHGTRCAYNELWRRRDELADMLKKRGGSLAMLRLPIAPDGGVLKRMVHADAERRQRAYAKEEKVHGGGKTAALKRVWLLVQGKSSSRLGTAGRGLSESE